MIRYLKKLIPNNFQLLIQLFSSNKLNVSPCFLNKNLRLKPQKTFINSTKGKVSIAIISQTPRGIIVAILKYNDIRKMILSLLVLSLQK